MSARVKQTSPSGSPTHRLDFENIPSIRARGFEGFVRIADLQKSACCDVPAVPGIYIVLRPSATPPQFLSESTGGYFKRKSPTDEVRTLKKKWINGALVLNIGKAGPKKGRTLRSRLKQYMQFGIGKPVGHRGGRYIWQLQDSGDLLICWKRTSDANPRDAEGSLILDFESVYGQIPFANLQH